MGRQRLATFAHDPIGYGVRDSLIIPLALAVNSSMKLHPATALPMQVIADRLFDVRFLFAGVPRLGDELAMKPSRATSVVVSNAF